MKNQDSLMVLIAVVSDNVLQVGFLEVSELRVKWLGRSSTHRYTQHESFVVGLDEALQELDPRSESLHDIIFVCDPHWFVDGVLKKEKEDFIQNASKELSLNALGFVLSHEAILHGMVASQAKMPKLLLSVSELSISITLIDLSAEILTINDERTLDINEDLNLLFRSFASKYDNLDEIKDMVLCVSNASDIDTRALVSGIDLPRLAKTFFDREMIDLNVVFQDQLWHFLTQEAGRATAVAKSLQPPHIDLDKYNFSDVRPSSSADDQAGKSAVLEPNFSSSITSVDSVDDVRSLRSDDFELVEKNAWMSSGDLSARGDNPASKDDPELDRLAQANSWMADKSHKHFMIYGFVIGVLTLVLGGLLYLYQFSQIQVSVTRQPKIVSQELSLVLDTNITESDPENMKIKAEVVSVEVADSGSLATSGVTIVGEPAKGKVVIINKTTGEKEFSAGSVLSFGNLEFVLDKAVIVPASVITERTGGEEREYGQAKVDVTAKKIGEEGNINKATDFVVANYDESSFVARADDSFSGGTSREVAVVAQSDQDQLLEELRKQLLDSANKKLKSQAKSGVYIHTTDVIEDEKTVFNAKVGEEAKEIKLELSMKVSALAYKSAEVKPISAQILKNNLPEGYILSDDDPDVLSASDSKNKDDSIHQIIANISARALPVLDTKQLLADLENKSLEDGVKFLSSQEQIKEVAVGFQPDVARFLISSFPSQTERIKIFVE